MRKFLICEVLCIAAFGCNAAPEDPVEQVLARSSATPTPPGTGIVPALGWGASYDVSLLGYQRNNDGTVTFHGGTWAVPITARPGDSVADVSFTFEAPTGHVGDPSTVIVELFSSQSAAVLGQVSLTPFGIGSYVNGDIPLSPARTVAPGETFELIFIPLDPNGNYAATDTKIDAVQLARAPVSRWIPASAFVLTNGTATLADGIWSPNGSISLTRWEAPASLRTDETITSLEAFYVRHGIVDSVDAYTLKLRQRLVSQGATLPVATDIAMVQVNGAAISGYPNVDSIVISGPIAVPSGAEPWLRFEFFENTNGPSIPHSQLIGVRLSTR